MSETIYEWFTRLMFGSGGVQSPASKTSPREMKYKNNLKKKNKYVNRHKEDRRNVIAWMRQEWQSQPYLPQYQMAKLAQKAVKKGQIILKFPKTINTLAVYAQYADPLPKSMRLNRRNLLNKANAKNM